MRNTLADRSRLPFVFVTLGVIAIVGACSSEPAATPSGARSSGSSGDTPTVSTADCASRCGTKAKTCGAPASQAEQGCAQLCAAPITEAQVACLEASDCERLEGIDGIDELCPKSSGSSGSNGSSGTSSGSSGDLPTALTIKGRFGNVNASHISSNGKIVSVLSVAPQPTFSPSQPSPLPVLTDEGANLSVSSPTLGDCQAKMTFVLNASQIGVSITGEDTLPETACSTFTDDIAKNGLKATLANVPYPNSSTKATVTVDLSP